MYRRLCKIVAPPLSAPPELFACADLKVRAVPVEDQQKSSEHSSIDGGILQIALDHSVIHRVQSFEACQRHRECASQHPLRDRGVPWLLRFAINTAATAQELRPPAVLQPASGVGEQCQADNRTLKENFRAWVLRYVTKNWESYHGRR